MVNSWRISLLSITRAGTSFLAITNHRRPHTMLDASLASDSSVTVIFLVLWRHTVATCRFHQDNHQYTSHQYAVTLNITSACALQHKSSFANATHNCSSWNDISLYVATRSSLTHTYIISYGHKHPT